VKKLKRKLLRAVKLPLRQLQRKVKLLPKLRQQQKLKLLPLRKLPLRRAVKVSWCHKIYFLL